MSKPYFSIPLRKRLEAFKRNGRTKLGHGWHDPAPDHANKIKGVWHWVPGTTINTGLINGESHHGAWCGEPFTLKGSSTELRFVENLSGYFRNVTPAHEIVSLKHTGWYVDNFQSETCHGLVMQIPGRDGTPRYLYGVNDPWNSNSGMVAWRTHEWTGSKEDAARWADSMAEHYAEICREDDAKFQAEQQIEEKRNRIVEIRTELRKLAADIRQSKVVGSVCDALRGSIQALREESHECHQEIEKLKNNPWEAVS